MTTGSVIRPHRLTPAQFRGLASGYGDPDTIGELVRSQRSKRRLELLAVRRLAGQAPGPVTRSLDDALALISVAEAADADAVRAGFTNPFLDEWATRCLTAGRVDADAVSYLCGCAIAIAQVSGARFELDVPVSPGGVMVPGRGRLRVDEPVVRAVGGPSGLTFVAGGRDLPVPPVGDGPHWTALRFATLEAGRRGIAIQTLDPYRDAYRWPLRPPMDPAESDAAGELITAAWRIVRRDHPEHAAAMMLALDTIVPMTPPGAGQGRSATSRTTFGAIAVALATSPADLAHLLIHEFQHMKLWALIDLADDDLVDPLGEGRYFAPWRPDPRPARMVLHGAYAHLGVADFWRRYRFTTDDLLPHFEYVRWRKMTLIAIDELSHSDELTDAGRRFVAHLRDTLSGWDLAGTPAAVVTAASDSVMATTVHWRLANRPADPESVTGDPAPEAPLAAIMRQWIGGRIPPLPIAAADRLLLEGRYADAARAYAEAIAAGDGESWVGLAVALSRSAPRLGQALVNRPELAHARYAATSPEVTPIMVAEWLAGR